MFYDFVQKNLDQNDVLALEEVQDIHFCVYLVSCDGLCVVGLPHNEGSRGVEHLCNEDDGRAWWFTSHIPSKWLQNFRFCFF